MYRFDSQKIKIGFFRLFCSGIVLLSILLILVSCPSPITEENLTQVKNTVAPEITILSPEDGCKYTEEVSVIGIVTDLASNSDDAGG